MSSAIVAKGSQLYSTDNITFNLLKNSNCWIDFSDTNYYTTTGTGNLTLATVTDKSNDARTITIVGTPRFDEGLKSMFNVTSATGNYLNVSTGGPTTTNRNETVFIVFSPTSSGGGGLFGSSTTGARYCRYGPNLGYGLQGSGPVATVTNLTIGQVEIGTFVCDNGSTRIYLDGKYEITGTTNFSANATTTQVGRAGNTTYVMIGNLYEIIFFNDVLADDQRQLIEYYLYRKWRVVNTISSPTSISGCTLWLDGNDASTITFSSGTSVSQWNDKSGNNYHAVQATTARQPTYNSTNKGVVFVQANTQFMTSTAPYTGSANEECIYIVFKQTGAANANLIGTSDTARGRQIRTQASKVVIFNGATSTITGIRTLNTSDIYIVEFVNITGRCLVNINKSVDGNSGKVSFASGTWTQVIGGATTSGAVSYDGTIYELVVFNRSLSGSERYSMLNYLYNKWNITTGSLLNSYHPYATVPPYLRPSMPSDVLGCQLWLDAADRNTVTLSGSNVTQWNDKSGNANHASGGTSPTYTTNAVVFNGTTHYLTTPYSASFGTETFYFVGTLTGSTSAGVFHTLMSASANGGRHLFTGGTALFVNSQNVQSGPTGGTITANQRTLFQYNRGLGNAITLLLNGNSVATGSLNAYTAGLTSWIGRWPGSSIDNWEGSIHEIIGYNRVLSVGERQLIEGYLAQKWGLKSFLPSTHSFKTELALSPRFDLEKFFGLQINLWLDASDPNGNGTLPASGTVISTWYDKSSRNKNCSQSTVSRRPTFTYDGKYPAIYFDRANTQFLVQDAPVGLLTSRNYSIFLVTRATSIPGNSQNYTTFFNQKTSSATTTNNTVNIFILSKNSTGTLFRNNINIYYGNGGTASLTGKFYSVTNPSNSNDRNLLVINDDSVIANNCFFENGSSGAANFSFTGSFANVTTDTFGYMVGTTGSSGTPSTSNCLDGYIYEIIVTIAQPTFSQQQQIEGYLAWKWGLQNNLPSTHPYSKYPPY